MNAAEGCKLFVYGVATNTPKEEVQMEFERFGKVTDTFNSGKGYAFVTFDSPDEAALAREQMNGQNLAGQQIKVDLAKPRAEGDRGGRGGGRGRGRGFSGGDRGGFRGGRGGPPMGGGGFRGGRDGEGRGGGRGGRGRGGPRPDMGGRGRGNGGRGGGPDRRRGGFQGGFDD